MVCCVFGSEVMGLFWGGGGGVYFLYLLLGCNGLYILCELLETKNKSMALLFV